MRDHTRFQTASGQRNVALARLSREHPGILVAVLCHSALHEVAVVVGRRLPPLPTEVADPANSPHDLADDSLATNLKP